MALRPTLLVTLCLSVPCAQECNGAIRAHRCEDDVSSIHEGCVHARCPSLDAAGELGARQAWLDCVFKSQQRQEDYAEALGVVRSAKKPEC
eukprot:6203364-Pleurochrysis_carterae.AAC.5